MGVADLPAISITWMVMLFFTGMDVAFQAANKLVIDLEEKQGFWRGKLLLLLVKEPSWFFCTTRIGQLLAIVLLSMQILLALATPAASVGIQQVFVLVVQAATILLGMVVLTKAVAYFLFFPHPNRTLDLLIYPFVIFFLLLLPLTFAVITLSRSILKRTEDIPFAGIASIFIPIRYRKNVADTATDQLPSEELKLNNKILRNALEFRNVKVRECMIPRTEIIAMDIQEGMNQLRKTFIQSGHSKIIIYNKNIDNIIGFCSSSALFRQPQTVEEILTPIITIPETTLASELMTRFINERKSLAVVMDEFGGTSGLVSMEDVIEEIFGEIEDEYDSDELTELVKDANTFVFSGRLEIDYLNDTYSLNLPTGDYDTLGGLILSITEDFPKAGDRIAYLNFTFTIQSTQSNRIGIVKVTRHPLARDSGGENDEKS